MVYFLSSLPGEEYVIVQDIFEKYESCNIKDQKLSRTQRGLVNCRLDCKGFNFKPLRGVVQSERKIILEKISNEELSFIEMAESCKRLKQLTEVKSHFMRYLNIKSWEVAEEKYPQHSGEANLVPF